MDFNPGLQYSRPDVKERAGLPRSAQGGDWDTGIVEHEGEFVIFSNVGTEGRTGHDYGNRWEGAWLRWYHKTRSNLTWPSVARLLVPGQRIHVFWRSNNSSPFTYAGLARPLEVRDTSPVEILWSLETTGDEHILIDSPEELPSATYTEGSSHKVLVNAYERDPKARLACIKHHGAACCVCGFSFGLRYGSLGAGFIHVHHLVSLAEIRGEYEVDPIRDLRPVCPNCHAMIHRRRPALSIDQLRTCMRSK